MTWDAGNARFKGTPVYSLVSDNRQHPDSTDSVRAWTAPRGGVVRVTGSVRKFDSTQGDGTESCDEERHAGVARDRVAGDHHLDPGHHDLSIPVAAGDQITFTVNQNGDNGWDTTYWSPVVSYSSTASRGFSFTSPVQGANGWSYQQWTSTAKSAMSWDASAQRWAGTSRYALVSNVWQHPDASADSAGCGVLPRAEP